MEEKVKRRGVEAEWRRKYNDREEKRRKDWGLEDKGNKDQRLEFRVKKKNNKKKRQEDEWLNVREIEKE